MTEKKITSEDTANLTTGSDDAPLTGSGAVASGSGATAFGIGAVIIGDIRRAVIVEGTNPYFRLWQKKIEEKRALLVFYITLAHDLDPHLVSRLTLDRILDFDFYRALDRTFDLDEILRLCYFIARDLDHPRIRSYTRDFAHKLNNILVGESNFFTRKLEDELTLVRELARTRDRDLSIDLAVIHLLTKSIILVLEMAKILTSAANDSANLRLMIEDNSLGGGFSPDYLSATVMPYLAALIEMQHVIDEMRERVPTPVKVLGISYGSITVDITGGIRDTVELVLDNVVPWRRENKKKLAEYEALQKRVEIEKTKAALTSEVEQAPDKARLVRAEADRLELENQKVQLEIMKLALEMVEKVKPGLPEEQKLLYAMKMVNPTRLIALSPLEITDVEVVAEEKKAEVKVEGEE